MKVALACDVMTDLGGSIRPAVYLASELVKSGYEVTILSLLMSKQVENHLKSMEIEPINLRTR